MKVRNAVIMSLLISPSLAFAAPQRGQAPVDTIFIPQGFDSNDKVEIALHGDFTNSCGRIVSTSSSLDVATNVITVDADYLQYGSDSESTEFCAQVVLPFIEVVNLGVLNSGNYKLQLKGHPEVTASLTIDRAKTESPDDYLYAPVENAWIETNPETGRQSFSMQGTFPHWFIGCQVIKDVQIIKQGPIVVVLPITEITEQGCTGDEPGQSFEVKKGLPFAIESEGLLHVRTMNSHSVNRYIAKP